MLLKKLYYDITIILINNRNNKMILKESNIKKIATQAKKIQQHKYSIPICIFFLLIISFIQIITTTVLISTQGIGYVDSPVFGEDLLWVTIISLILTTSLIPFTVIAAFKLGTKEKNAFVYQAIGYSFFILNDVILGLWFHMTALIIIIILLLRQYINWDKELGNQNFKKLNRYYLFLLYVLAFLLIFALGYLINLTFWKFNLFSNEFNIKHFIPFLDANILVCSIIGFSLFSKHYKEAYLFFFTSNILSLFLYSIQFQITLIAITLTYILIDILGYINWEYQYYFLTKNILNENYKIV